MGLLGELGATLGAVELPHSLVLSDVPTQLSHHFKGLPTDLAEVGPSWWRPAGGGQSCNRAEWARSH